MNEIRIVGNDLIISVDEVVATIENAALIEDNRRLQSENAKLRELVRDMWFWGYEGHMDSESQEWQMNHIDGVLDRMRELGVDA